MTTPACFFELNFRFNPELRQKFREGTLGHNWKKRYPQLFDDKDLELYESQHKTYHFCEWYAAIILWETLGYRSMAKYGAKAHKLKRPALRRIVSKEIYHYIVPDWEGMPDLIAFSPDMSQYFFCEVKGPNDSLDARQSKCARRLCKMSNKRVALLHLQEDHSDQMTKELWTFVDELGQSPRPMKQMNTALAALRGAWR